MGVKCQRCRGTGEIVRRGHEINCPDCHGFGTYRKAGYGRDPFADDGDDGCGTGYTE